MARKSDWSQDSDTEWTFSRGGVQATIDFEPHGEDVWEEYEYEEDLLEGEYHAIIVDNDQVVSDTWHGTLNAAKAEIESIVRGIV